MENYGSDKPDLRFSFKISDVTDIASQSDWTPIRSALQGNIGVAKAFVMTGGGEYIKKSHQKNWEEIAKKEIGLPGVSLLKVQNKNIVKPMTGKAFSEELSQLFVNHLEAKEGDVIVMSVGHKSKVLKLLGKLRIAAAEVLESNNISVRGKEEFNFLWVTDFPLFEMDETTEKLITCHHPFTAPKPDHIQKLYENPLEVLSQHYDLVLNGCEIAGGSIRIYEEKLQRDIFDILNIDPAKFTFLLEALSSGAPPHGGIALGFDRYISILRNCRSIRDVIGISKIIDRKVFNDGGTRGYFRRK
ncbi:Aspartate--tRNA ligase, mitochondrial [Armadillidium vulgare]|nr:Aspartate--tRNA ligase, mitochondrial [Armadillidium vulgare]